MWQGQTRKAQLWSEYGIAEREAERQEESKGTGKEESGGRCHERLSGHALSELTRRDENQTICGNKFDFGLKIVSHKIATQLKSAVAHLSVSSLPDDFLSSLHTRLCAPADMMSSHH